MNRTFVILFLVQSLSGFCQGSVKSDQLDSLIHKFELLLKKDDSLLVSILENRYHPNEWETFNYDQLLSDYMSFKTRYKSNLKSKNFPKSLPVKNIQNKVIIGFGNKMHPVFKTVKHHNGIDIPIQKGCQIRSTINGKVILAKKSYGMLGNQVIIQNAENVKIQFYHLDQICVKEGDSVTNRQIIGTAGNTGLSMGNHLHYEILIDEEPIDPVFTIFRRFSVAELEHIYNKNSMSLD